MDNRLFRSEATDRQRGSFVGNVHLGLPLSWQIIGYLIFIFYILGAVFLGFGSYARVEVARGQIVPDLGSIPIVPTRVGIISNIKVSEGSIVNKGSPLVTVLAEEVDPSGSTGPTKVLTALKEQNAQLLRQQEATMAGVSSTRARLRSQIDGIRAEMAAIDRQIDDQRILIKSVQEDLARFAEAATKGFISKHDMQQRKDLLISRRQQLDALLQARAEKNAEAVSTFHAIAEAETQAGAIAAGIAVTRASIAQQVYNVDASRGYTLTAPVAGKVTALTVRAGQSVQTNTPLMTIVPAGARMQAWLFVPMRAAGFISPGQTVRLELDAFPYTTFGTIAATVRTVSSAAIAHRDEAGQMQPVYLVTAEIAEPRIYGFGRRHELQPDMTLTARIVTQKRSFAQFLFDPIFAVRGR